jgi:hypothetical protein
MAFMHYAAALPFPGNVDRALRLAESSLTSLGFLIRERTPEMLVLRGPGLNSTRQSPLLGVTHLHIAGGDGQLSMEAHLGGARRLALFVLLFPPLLCLSLAIIPAVVLGTMFGIQRWLLAFVAPVGVLVLVWSMLGPILAWRIRARTCRGLDALLANMVTVGSAE